MQPAQPQPDQVAPKQAEDDDVAGVVQEYFPDAPVRTAHGLEDADHARALEDEDEQGRDHVDDADYEHQRQDDHFVDVLQAEPFKDLGKLFAYGLCIQIGREHFAIDVVGNHLQIAEVVHKNLKTAHLIGFPALQLPDFADIHQGKLLVVFFQSGAEKSLHAKGPLQLFAVLDEVYDQLVARF